MPRIKVYKGRGQTIPVSEAKTATAFKCPFTNTVHNTKRGYVKHLTDLRSSRMHRNARAKVRLRKMEDLWNQTSFEKIVNWVEMNPDVFWQNGKGRSWHGDGKAWDRIRDEFWIRITHLDVRWSESVSNTHSCPRSGVTNWGGRNSDAPRGYPGWQGRIEYQVSHDVPCFGSELLSDTGIHTGTGGGISNNRYGFGVEFFAADWPGLVKGQNWDALRGTENTHTYLGKPDYFRH